MAGVVQTSQFSYMHVFKKDLHTDPWLIFQTMTSKSRYYKERQVDRKKRKAIRR